MPKTKKISPRLYKLSVDDEVISVSKLTKKNVIENGKKKKIKFYQEILTVKINRDHIPRTINQLRSIYDFRKEAECI